MDLTKLVNERKYPARNIVLKGLENRLEKSDRLKAAVMDTLGLLDESADDGINFILARDADGNLINASLAFVNVKDYKVSADVDYTNAIVKVRDNGKIAYTPEGVYETTLLTAQLPKRMTGLGQVEDTYGKRAPHFIYQDSPPASLGDHSFIGTSFNGDISKLHLAMEKWILGAATVGQPTTLYQQDPENAMIYLNSYFAAGHNESLSGNDGRTGSSQLHLKFTHAGQGDYGAIFINGTVTGAKPGATHFLASPAGVMLNGGLIALSNGAFLNITELNAYDSGFDAAAMTIVSNYHRSVGTAALGECWIFCRAQSKGTVAADVAYSLSGKWKVGLDLTAADLGANKAGITMKANDRIYGGAVSSGIVAWCQNPGDDWMDFDTGSGWRFAHDNVVAMTAGKTSVNIVAPQGLLIGNTGVLRLLGANQATTGTSTPTFAATNKPGATGGVGPATWMKVVIGGTDHYIPAWAA